MAFNSNNTKEADVMKRKLWTIRLKTGEVKLAYVSSKRGTFIDWKDCVTEYARADVENAYQGVKT